MSSTNRSEGRDPFDYYPTPPWMVHRLLERLTLPGGRWIEPCAGDGAIIRACQHVHWLGKADWRACEIQPVFRDSLNSLITHHSGAFIGDYREYPRRPFSVGITNPPFPFAEECVELMLRDCEHVIILQRLNWVAGPRAKAFRSNMPDVYVLPDRAAFDARGSDSIEYAWFHWEARNRAQGKIVMLDSTLLDVRKIERAMAIETMKRFGVDPWRGTKEEE